MPLKPTESVLLPVSVTAAARAFPAVGVKVTLTMQTPLAASVAGLMGQLLVCAKSPAFAPVTAIPVIVSALDPLLVTVIV